MDTEYHVREKKSMEIQEYCTEYTKVTIAKTIKLDLYSACKDEPGNKKTDC